jgi:5-methylcytosine-specific restriction endonuclease McrA
MDIKEAKTQILDLLKISLGEDGYKEVIFPEITTSVDLGKFELLHKPARAIHRFNGWMVPVNLSWFTGGNALPIIKGEEFYWYAFAIPSYAGFKEKHYFICDFTQIKDWVLEFSAPLGKDYRNQRTWRADFHPFDNSNSESLGYFRWGDEAIDNLTNENRVIHLDNIRYLLNLTNQIYVPKAIDIEIGQELATTSRTKVEVNRIIRDTNITKDLKALYKNRCQICNLVIGFNDVGYSEAHHIMPLGNPHNGSDSKSNIVILCPNHHAEFDYGYIAINPESMKIIHVDKRNKYNSVPLQLENTHKLDRSNLAYHYENIFIKS